MEAQICFVAFLDILGFKDMVRKEFETSVKGTRFLPKMLDVHSNTLALDISKIPISIQQFSDSIVISTPFQRSSFHDFLTILVKYQWYLFKESILVRGGVSNGYHFYNDGFTFSQGLVQAYEIEREHARFPRIVVSPDLLELTHPYRDEDFAGLPLVLERDGLYFVDFASFGSANEASKQVAWVKEGLNTHDASVRDKYLWLSDYLRFKFGGIMSDVPRFSLATVARPHNEQNS